MRGPLDGCGVRRPQRREQRKAPRVTAQEGGQELTDYRETQVHSAPSRAIPSPISPSQLENIPGHKCTENTPSRECPCPAAQCPAVQSHSVALEGPTGSLSHSPARLPVSEVGAQPASQEDQRSECRVGRLLHGHCLCTTTKS